jgi:hypothetical protein
MRTIIAGSRGCTDKRELLAALAECGWTPTVVISGAAPGADTLGEEWAKKFNVPCERYPADWKRLGKSAGHQRNQQMATAAEALIALWDGTSPGTHHMITAAKRRGLRIHIYMTNAKEDET